MIASGPLVASTVTFVSGFESPVTTRDADGLTYLTGEEQLSGVLSDWTGIEDAMGLGHVAIQYQGGDVSQRRARVVADPTGAANHVLHYWLKEPNVAANLSPRGRVQLNFYKLPDGTRTIRQRCRLFLPPEFANLRAQDDGFVIAIIGEFWNDPNWMDLPYPFRMGVRLQKLPGVGGRLTFQVEAEWANQDYDGWKHLWEAVPESFEVPLGEWLEIEYRVVEGDESTGRFQMLVTDAQGRQTTVCDVHNFTHNPFTTRTNGFWGYNPLKLYSKADIIEMARDADFVLQAYWDDLAVQLSGD